MAGTIETLLVFAVGEALLTLFVLFAGQHRRARRRGQGIAVFGAPVLYCAIGVLVLAEAGTLSVL
jgi:hypothetical protein